MNMNDNERALLAENESLRLELAGLERENARLREAALVTPRDYDEVVLYLDQARRGVLTDVYAVEELLLRLYYASPIPGQAVLREHHTTPGQETT